MILPLGMGYRAYLLVLLVSCARPQLSTTTAHSTVDSRLAIQQMLDRQGFAALGADTYEIGMAPVVGTRRAYDMLVVGKGQQLYGVGPETILHFSGDAGGQDWHGIALRGDGAQLHDMTLDTSALTGTSEQTHAVYVPGPIVNPLVTAMHFNHPQRRTLPGGDCIQLVGYAPDRLITGARLINNSFDHCDRSGVAIHSGAVDLQITTSTFPDTGDNDIDGEGSGDNADWVISLNTFGSTAHSQGDIAIELQGLDRATVSDNTFNGRGLFLYGVQHVDLSYNDILRTTPGGPTAAVFISKDSTDISLKHNTISRAAGVYDGNLISIAPHGTGTPARIAIDNNTLYQGTNASVITSSGVVGLEVADNGITYAGTVAKTYMAVDALASTTVRTDAISLLRNTITGPMLACLRVSGSYAGTGAVTTADNTADGMLQGIRCESVYSGAKVLGPVTAARNAWPAPACGVAGFVQTQ